jgi:hypothetical protein
MDVTLATSSSSSPARVVARDSMHTGMALQCRQILRHWALFALLILFASPLYCLPQGPHARAHRRGGQPQFSKFPTTGRGNGGQRGLNDAQNAGAHSAGAAEDWEEERRVANLLSEKIVRKLSMKRWLEERQRFFPTPSAVQRLKVEEGEEMRDKIFAQEGWRVSKRLSQFYRPQRTRWEETAKKELSIDTSPSSRCPVIDLNRVPIPGGSHVWGLDELRGGAEEDSGTEEHDACMQPAQKKWWWREAIDGIFEVGMEKGGTRRKISLSGLLLDCMLADHLLHLVQLLIDVFVAIPITKLVTRVLFPLLLPSLKDFPHVAGLSILIAHWGMRLAKTVMAAICAGQLVAYAAHHKIAFTRPLIPVLYTCLSSLWTTSIIISRLLQDPRFQGSVSLSGICFRLLTCELPGLSLFMWAACSENKDVGARHFLDQLFNRVHLSPKPDSLGAWEQRLVSKGRKTGGAGCLETSDKFKASTHEVRCPTPKSPNQNPETLSPAAASLTPNPEPRHTKFHSLFAELNTNIARVRQTLNSPPSTPSTLHPHPPTLHPPPPTPHPDPPPPPLHLVR